MNFIGGSFGRALLRGSYHHTPTATLTAASLSWSGQALYAFPLLIALLWGVPAVFQVDPIGAYFRYTVDPLFNLLVPR